MAKKKTDLQLRYESVVDEYLQKFIKKQGYEFDGWISDEVGGTAEFINQYYFSFDDIKQDIDRRVKKGTIFQWQDDNLEKPFSMGYNQYLNELQIKG